MNQNLLKNQLIYNKVRNQQLITPGIFIVMLSEIIIKNPAEKPGFKVQF